MKFVFALTLVIWTTTLSVHGFARDLAKSLATQTGDIEIRLNEPATASNILVEGRTVHVMGTDELGSPISSTSDAPMFIVKAGGTLVLEDVALNADASTNEQAATTAILVEGGTLEFNYSSYEGTRSFAIFARQGGKVVIQSSGLEGGKNAIAASSGTQLSVLDSSISEFSEAAISVRGPDTFVTLEDVRISHANRAISATDGASLSGFRVGISSIAEVGVMSSASSVFLSGFAITESPNIGIYAENPIELEITNGRITGLTNTAISLRGTGQSALKDVQITEAKAGILVHGSAHTLNISGLDSLTAIADAIHIVAGGGKMIVEGSTFTGGGAAIRTDAGGQIEVAHSLLTEGTHAGLIFQGGDINTNRLLLTDNNFLNRGKIPNLYFTHVEPILKGNLLSFEKIAIDNREDQAILLENNGFFGRVDTAIWNGTAYAKVPAWSNISNIVTQSEFVPTNLAGLSSDREKRMLHSAQVRQKFTILRDEFALSSDEGEMATIALRQADLIPAPHAAVFELFRVTGDGTSKLLGEVMPRDLPLSTPKGAYRLLFPSGASQVIELAAHETVELTLPPPSSPYALGVADGHLTIGKALNLRPQAQMRDLWSGIWPGYFALAPDFGRGYPVLRPDTTTRQLETARAFAREQLEAVAPLLTSVTAGATYGDLTEEMQEPYNRTWRVAPTAADILMIAGTQEDAAFLAETVAAMQPSTLTTFFATTLARASVHISLRMGDIGASPAVVIWQELEQRPTSAARTKLGIALGAVGYEPAIKALIQTIATDRHALEDPQKSDGAIAFRLIAHKFHPDVLALSRDLLVAFDNYSKAHSLELAQADASARKADPLYNGLYVTAVFDTAFGYASAYLQGAERSALNVAIPWWTNPSLLPFENPADLIDHIFGVSSQEYHHRNDNVLMDVACRLMGDLPHGDRQQVEQDYIAILTSLTAAQNVSPRPGAFAELRTRAALSHCGVNSRALRTLKSPKDTDFNLFPTWMQHGFVSPETFLPDFDAVAESAIASTAALAGFDKSTLDSALDTLAAPERTGLKFYKLLNAIADPSGIGKPGPFMRGNDKRYFLEPVEMATAQPLWLAAEITLAPRSIQDRTLFGINLSTAVGDPGGLAGMIKRSGEKIDALLANNGRSLIQSVVLRYDAGSHELAYVQSTDTGTHVFEVTEPIGSNANLYLDINFQGDDRGWTVTFPIFASPFGYRQIQNRSRITLAD